MNAGHLSVADWITLLGAAGGAIGAIAASVAASRSAAAAKSAEERAARREAGERGALEAAITSFAAAKRRLFAGMAPTEQELSGRSGMLQGALDETAERLGDFLTRSYLLNPTARDRLIEAYYTAVGGAEPSLYKRARDLIDKLQQLVVSIPVAHSGSTPPEVGGARTELGGRDA